MSQSSIILNHTKRQYLEFRNLPAWTKWELMMHPLTACVSTYYVLYHPGDTITTIVDEAFYDSGDYTEYEEVTDQTIQAMLDAGLLVDEGREYLSDGELYFRKLDMPLITWQFK